MIGTDYTPGLLAALVKTPHLRAMENLSTPKGQRVSSYTKRYTDDWVCKTTLFDVGDAELASTVADFDKDSIRFGFTLDHDVERVAVSAGPEGLCVSFTVHKWFEEELDECAVVLSGDATVEVRDDVEAVSAIEETHTADKKITSFFYDETSGEPWLTIVE